MSADERTKQDAIWEMEGHITRAIDVARRAGIDRARVIRAVNDFFGVDESEVRKVVPMNDDINRPWI